MTSERPSQPSPVILDANLLHPFQMRNLLVQLGVDAVITPRWTERIHEEWIGNLVAADRAPRDRLLVTLALMNAALPEAEVRGWETCMEGLILPDPDDRHVVAAALAAGARTIPTIHNSIPACAAERNRKAAQGGYPSRTPLALQACCWWPWVCSAPAAAGRM